MNTCSTAAWRLGLDDAAFAELAAPFLDSGVLEPVDVQTVDLVAGALGRPSANVQLALALAVRAPRHGHVGVDLRTVATRIFDESQLGSGNAESGISSLAWPDPENWLAEVEGCPLVALISTEDELRPRTPFVMHDGILMADRFWRLQLAIRDALLERASIQEAPVTTRAGDQGVPVDTASLSEGLARLFRGDGFLEQRLAAAVAVLRPLSVVSGGPGTGKTTTVRNLLVLLYGQWARAHGRRPDALPEQLAPLVALAAPTGKAATRMEEAIREGLEALEPPPGAEGAVQWLRTLRPSTLHRLLIQARPTRSGASRLPHDVVVVDEASMIDLMLMRRLVEAVRPEARLILLGDRDQLASVAAGTVLADLTRGVGPAGMSFGPRMASRLHEIDPTAALSDKTSSQERPLANSVVQLIRSHRQEKGSGIWRVMTSIADAQRAEEQKQSEACSGHIALAVDWLTKQRDDFGDLHFVPHVDGKLASAALLRMIEGWLPIIMAARHPSGDHGKLLKQIENFRVLAAHRRGPLGVAGLNEAIGAAIAEAVASGGELPTQNRLEQPRRVAPLPASFIGRPVIVTENRYDVQRMNGDVGIVVPGEGKRKHPRVAFPGREGRTVEYLDLSSMPPHETVFAMTIHKSQGSQFAHTMLVLPTEMSRILTRELIYTAITRSRSDFTLAGTREVLQESLSRTVVRASTLGPLLWT